MKTYLISYDLIKPETSPEYSKLINMIKSVSFWAKPLDSLWLIKSDLRAIDILEKLKTVIDSNDRIVVIEIKNVADWATYNISREVIDWMRPNL